MNADGWQLNFDGDRTKIYNLYDILRHKSLLN